MARLPRLSLPGYPHHVIQRGNNRQTIFVDRQDHETMLGLLAENARKFDVAVHAYVLMDNHFHLLATPGRAGALSGMMQAVGRSYVRYFNLRHGRTGTLWEGRYRSTVLQTERYLMACMAYIDLHPVRDGRVSQPGDWPWSSHSHYRGVWTDRVVTPHALYWALGNTPFDRENAYAEQVRNGLADTQWHRMESAVRGGWALGSPAYLAALAAQGPTRRLTQARPGRPRRPPAAA